MMLALYALEENAGEEELYHDRKSSPENAYECGAGAVGMLLILSAM